MSTIVLSYCKENKNIDLLKQYSLSKYDKYYGSKAHPYNMCREFDTEDAVHMKAFKNIAKSYVHSPFAFSGGARSNSNMLRTKTIIFDFDQKENHDDWSIAQWRESELAKASGWVLVTSKSHSNTSDCFHVFMPISEEITDAKTYTAVLRKIRSMNGIKSDPAVTDAARLFNPSRKSGERVGDNFKFHNQPGQALDITKYLKVVEAEEAEAEAEKERINKLRSERKLNRIDYRPVNSVFNGHAQVKAIINKGYTSIDLDGFIDEIANEIVSEIAIHDYTEWISAGHAIKRFAGESGMLLWSTLCSNNPEADKKDSQRYSTFKADVDGLIQPLFKIGENNGWEVSNELASRIIGWDLSANNELKSSEIDQLEKLFEMFS